MGRQVVAFDGSNIGNVLVDDTAWAKALLVIVDPRNTESKNRERIAVAKLLEAGLACTVASDESYDVQVGVNGDIGDNIRTVRGGTHLRKTAASIRADIKTLYPSHDFRSQSASGVGAGVIGTEQDHILGQIDKAVAKENRQGNACLFDLSYVTPGTRQGLVGIIHNSVSNAITLEYDRDGKELHVALPGVFEFHRGSWYR
ncbi:hypothetical protein G4G28_13530 [Massilia sp. Dwa41.01b]|uniref:hypothetical protein n=1 Tax=unclassified Massilia TaxID=2609279 RepID=UPI0015FECCF0|nr:MULTISPECIES: hypothetical protein [unclassified Massilia]QNA89233.1 hypothetical protein G4G28_13530 [Massilia sp. Dwa41.01b]QNB00136.1 hypothetical protein G4G31_17095 [Massilia sp. Se16.2.3]